MPSISVILPVYNGANYLSQSIESVLNQSFRDFELLILDDGSKDTSLAIARAYEDSRIRVLPNPKNLGLFRTLNRGFEESRAELIKIWAHDDKMLPSCLQAFIDIASTHPNAGVFYSDFYEIDAQGARTGGEKKYENDRARIPELSDSNLAALQFLCFGCLPGNISTVSMRKTTWAMLNGFKEIKQQAPDYDMWVRASELTSTCFLNDRTIELREHPLQLGRLGQKQMTTVEEELDVLNQLKGRLSRYIDKNSLNKIWRTHRGRQHVHWIFKSLVRGDFIAARRGIRALMMYDQPRRAVLTWLTTINGRFFTEPPWMIFDKHRPKLYTESSSGKDKSGC